MGDGSGSLSTNEQGVLAAGALAAILSLVPGYIHVSFEGRGFDMSTSAWTGFATIGMVLLLGSAALVGLQAYSHDTLPQVVPWHLVSMLFAVVGTALIVLRAFTAGSEAPGADVGPGWSGWLLIVVAIALSFFAVRTFRESDDEVHFSDSSD